MCPRTRCCRRRTNLAADESLLTGESVPVRKVARATGARSARPGGDDLPYVYSGTLVTSGQGVAEVRRDRRAHRDGPHRRGAADAGPERTRLQRETDALVRVLAVVGLALCAVVVAGLCIDARRPGSTACWPASRWPCRSCPRSSRSC